MPEILYVIKLPDKDKTFKGNKPIRFVPASDGNGFLPTETEPEDISVREKFVETLITFGYQKMRKLDAAEIVPMNVLIQGLLNLSDDDNYLEVSKEDCKRLQEGFNELKPEQRSPGTYVHLGDFFEQLDNPEKLEDWKSQQEQASVD